jgi:membrane protease YdiL (CAAX protease family)
MNASDREDGRSLREMLALAERVRAHPTIGGFVAVVAQVIRRPLRHPVGIILLSTAVLMAAWGRDGELPWLHSVWSGWRPATDPAGRPSVIPGVPWDQEWIAFAAGFVLLVVIPCAIAKLWFHHDLRDYGLGLPVGDRARLAAFSALFLMLAAVVPFLFATGDEGMKATYPLYRGALDGWDFVAYEAGYFVFFVVIEFVFRGWLLLGLFSVKDRDALPEATGERGPLLFGYYALFISQVAYTAWHLGKPTPELLGTLVWGPVAGAVVLLTRSIWPIVVVHFALNVLLDLILR